MTEVKGLHMLEIVQPQVEIIRVCFLTSDEKIRFQSAIEGLLKKNKTHISEQEKEDAYKKLVENETEQFNKMKSTSLTKSKNLSLVSYFLLFSVFINFVCFIRSCHCHHCYYCYFLYW